MPGCIIRLSTIDTATFKGERWELPFVSDNVDGVFKNMMAGEE
jgi:hypothetical protein